jgi:hypothetical protein
LASGDGGAKTAVGADSEASGDASSAFGFSSEASGPQSSAYGASSEASGAASSAYGVGSTASGSDSAAYGNFSTASGDSSAAYGDNSEASGIGSSAYGSASTASGTSSSAYGAGSTASGEASAAYGFGSNASGKNSIAVGPNTTVAYKNAAAFGNGATATRPNQQVFGTSSNTYTMPGVTSSQSKSAQGRPTHIVTSNSNGDLAAHTIGQLGLATQSDVGALQSDINRLGRRDNELTDGLAAVASLAQPILRSGQSFGVTAAWGFYDDANAVGFSAAGVLADNLLRPGSGTLALFGGVGAGTSEGEVAGRAGVSFGW